MRAGSPARRGNRSWRRIEIVPEKMSQIADLLRECGSIGGDGDPISAHAHYDNAGRLRRLHAVYVNGWRATLVVRLDGSHSLSQAIKIVTPPKGDGGEQ